MKKYKLIPLLALASLLAGCNVNNASSSSKEPNFAKMGKEVDFQEFAEVAEDYTLLDLWMSPSSYHIPSFVATKKENGSYSNKVTSKKKVVAGGEGKYVADGKLEADMNNYRIACKYDEKTTSKFYDEYATQEYLENPKTEMVYQFATFEETVGEGEEAETVNKEYWIQADKLSNNYFKLESVTGQGLLYRRDIVESDAVSQMNNLGVFPDSLYNYMGNYYGAPVEEQANYHFYVNDKILTITYSTEYSETQIDASDHFANYITTVTIDYKFQLDATDGKNFKSKTFSKEVSEKKYLRNTTVDYIARYNGDVDKSVETTAIECAVQVKDVKVKEVDLSKMRLIDGLI